MNQIIFLFFLYILTLIGFFLGKITIEEHKEIKKFIKISLIILTNIFYGLSFAILKNNNTYILILVLLYIFYIMSLKKEILKEFHNILLLGISFCIIVLKTNYSYILILLVFSLTLENSFKKINLKQVLYEIVILSIIYFIFSII